MRQTGQTGQTELGIFHKEAVGDRPTLLMLHGWGADFRDLIPLSQELGWDGGVLSVNGPKLLGESGFAWFPRDLGVFKSMDPLSYFHSLGSELWPEIEAVGAYLGPILHARNISSLYTCGFSQGSIVALALALDGACPVPTKGIVAFSPGLWDPKGIAQRLADLGGSMPPVFMSHGRMDPVLPFGRSEELAGLLAKAADHSENHSDTRAVEFHPFDGYHEIPYNIVQKASQFLGKVRGK